MTIFGWAVGGYQWKWKSICSAGNGEDAVEGAEVGGEGAVVGAWSKDEFGKALDRIGWGGGKL